MIRARTIAAVVIIAVALIGVYFAFQSPQVTTQTTSITTTTHSVSTTSGTIASSITATGSTSSTTSQLSTIFSSSSSGTTTTSVSTSTSLTLSNSSVFNLCFVNDYDANITFINSLYYECSANLQSSQSIKQNVLGPAFSSSQLTGKYVVSINASYTVSVAIEENGSAVLNETGTDINYTGNIASGGSMYFTITNEGTIVNTYEFGIDFTS